MSTRGQLDLVQRRDKSWPKPDDQAKVMRYKDCVEHTVFMISRIEWVQEHFITGKQHMAVMLW